MKTCETCGTHTRTEASDAVCPNCGTPVLTRAIRAAPPRASFVLLGLALGGCGTATALYGVSMTDRVDTGAETGGVDNDSDGFYAETSGGSDCNDDDAAINPDAEETAGDGTDSNCDGEDDT